MVDPGCGGRRGRRPAGPSGLAGPIDATVYTTANTADTELVATVEEVSPSGRSQPLTSGAQIGSQRATDPARTWTGANGLPLLPIHPLTQAAQRPVVPARSPARTSRSFRRSPRSLPGGGCG